MWARTAEKKECTLCTQPEEKVEFSSLMYEIKVLTTKLLKHVVGKLGKQGKLGKLGKLFSLQSGQQ